MSRGVLGKQEALAGGAAHEHLVSLAQVADVVAAGAEEENA